MPTEGFQPFDDYGSDSSIRGLVAGQKVLKRYTLKRVLGRGGMGVVWLVRDDELDRDIAFKFLPDIVYHDKAAVESLKRETRRSLELTHPNIVRIYDFAQDEHCAGISMEYVAGDTLSNLRVCQPTHVFEVSELEKWVRQLCLALDYAHKEARVAHRDLKPANLMLNNRGVLKIADFGISRSISDNMTRVSSAVHGASGTLVYMSPQQALGEAASALDDIYSLGATLFELLTSKPPFFTGEIMTQVREKTPPTLAERRKQLGIMGKPIPPEWEETVAACLAKDPAKRPQSALEVLQRLGLADTAGMEAAGLTTTRAGEVVAEGGPKAQSDLPPTELAPLMQIDGPVSKTTTKPAQPPMEFIIDSKGFKPVGMADKPLVPQTTKPQRVARRGVLAMVAIMILLVAGFAWWVGTSHTRLKSGMGGIAVSALPEGASVKLANGRSLNSAGRIMDLAPGVYEVLVEKADHEPQQFRVEVVEGKFALLPKVELVAHLGRVVLASDPPGARFSIGGKVVQPDKNGALLAELPPGLHEITAEYGQWPPVRRQVTVSKDGELKELFEFYPGVVDITSTPDKARVFAGDREIGLTPLTVTNVPPGQVLYVLVKDDFNREVVRGEVRSKQVLTLDRKLTKDQGTLLLSSPVAGVSFYLDGVAVGQVGNMQRLETNVSPGKHVIEAVLAGWPKQEKTVEVTRGKVSPVQFEFAPAAVVIASDPSEASIIRQGVKVGTTPYTMREVKPGPLKLVLQLEGYDPVALDTNVLSGETLALHAVLPRKSRYFKIKTTPADAFLLVDGIPLTNRPLSATVGKHVLRAERNGYESREMEVEIKADGLNDFGEITLARAAGDLQVMTMPANATFEIFVSGERMTAKSAERLKGIPTGKQRVLIKAEGYDAQLVDVEIQKDQPTITDVITLKRSKGVMRILTTPEGAGYSLSGPDLVMRSGKTPNDELQLPTGTYQVAFTMAGYEPTNRTVEVHSQGTVAAEVSLIRSQVPLRIQVNLAGATYKLSGPEGFYREGTLPLPVTVLPTGSYKLEAGLEGYDAVKLEFELKKGENRPVQVELQRSKGKLLAIIEPVEARAELRGAGSKLAVVSGYQLEDVPTGNYELVSRYKEWSITNVVSIQSRKLTEEKVALPFGKVRVESVPEKAVVMRGSEEVGMTPWDSGELPLGVEKFQLRLPGHRFVEVAATVQAQKTVLVKSKLERYPGPQPGMTEWVNSLGMRFVPVGNVWVCVWETRKKDFEAFYKATRHNAGPGWSNPGFKQTASEPVVEVSWNDATAFSKWLTESEVKGKVLEQAMYRLPTQEEWKKVQREGYASGPYVWGKVWPMPSGTANLADNVSYDRHTFTSPAGSYFPARNGVYDLVGNVWEWCQDGNGNQRTLLGGSWMQYQGSDFSPGMQLNLGAETKSQDIGFRIILVPTPMN